jgi:hypothetical protein
MTYEEQIQTQRGTRSSRHAPRFPSKSKPITTYSDRSFDAVAYAAALEVIG